MMRCIHRDEYLMAIYQQFLRDGSDIDDAIHATFVEGPIDMKLWESMAVYDIPASSETEEMRDIRLLVEKHGWKRFMKGLTGFAERQVRIMKKSGLPQREKEWSAIADKFASTRKNVSGD